MGALGLYDRPAVAPPAPPRLPAVDSPDRGSWRWPPAGALIAAVVLVVALAMLAPALAGIPPFGTAVTPSAVPSAVSSATVSASPVASVPSASPTASPTPLSATEILEILGRIERRMSEIRELPAGQPLTPTLVTSAEASRLLVGDFRSENPPAILADQTLLR